ncbi:MAG TPA: DUF4198 domain-containing protein [Gemmatimonadaceae bacterium]|nr:DUF4198 domain-containing protein [Gemmatimonadaceae bacterium]
MGGYDFISVKHLLVAALVGVLAVLFAAGLAAAHETWILPASMHLAVNKTVALDLTSGMAFPADDFAIDRKRVARASARIGGTIEKLTRRIARPKSLRFLWTPRSEGVGTIGIELAPRTLLLDPKLIDEYYQEIHASPAIRAQWDSIPSPKRWRESYVKHATTFVRVGTPVTDTSWSIPLGLGLEIVPRRNPTDVRAGETLPVLVLRQGVPLAGLQLGARREGAAESSNVFVTTDASGHAAIALPRDGRWLIFGTDLRRAHETGLEWRSDFVTMTIGLGPHR